LIFVFNAIPYRRNVHRYWSRDRVALVSVSLAVGLLGGRLLVRPAPRLQPAYMLSTVCGSYAGIDSIAQCRIPVPRIHNDTEILVRQVLW
jgi:hypothetical protein